MTQLELFKDMVETPEYIGANILLLQKIGINPTLVLSAILKIAHEKKYGNAATTISCSAAEIHEMSSVKDTAQIKAVGILNDQMFLNGRYDVGDKEWVFQLKHPLGKLTKIASNISQDVDSFAFQDN